MSMALIIHAVVLAIAFLSAAYLVFATAQKSEGLLKSGGTILAALLAAIAALVLIGHLSAPMTGGRPFGIDMSHSGESTPATTTPGTPGGTAPADGAKPGGDAAPSDSGAGSDTKP